MKTEDEIRKRISEHSQTLDYWINELREEINKINPDIKKVNLCRNLEDQHQKAISELRWVLEKQP